MISIGHYIKYYITVEHTADITRSDYSFGDVKVSGHLDEAFKAAVCRHSRLWQT